MNDNGAHQDQPERQPALLDDLTNIIPQANTDFEDDLEAQLLARLRTQNQKIEERDMQNTIPLAKPLHRSIPLTLTASLLVVLIGVVAIFAFNTAPEGDPASGVALQPDVTATLDPLMVQATQIIIDATASALSPEANGTPTGVVCNPNSDWTGTHTVSEGQSLMTIAARYGVNTYELIASNCLGINTVLTPGQILLIPGETVATPTPDLYAQATQIIAEATRRAVDATVSALPPEANGTPTPVITDLQPVVLASRPIQAGHVIREANVSIAYVNTTFSTREVYTEINDDVIGRVAAVRIDPYTPITTANTTAEAFSPSEGMAVVSLPVNQISANLNGLEADDIVHLLYTRESDNSTLLTTEATVVSIDESFVTFFVPQADAQLIYATIDYSLRITAALRPDDLPSGTVAVDVPRDDLALLSPEPVEVGQTVDLLAALLFIATDDEFQTLYEQAPEQLETTTNAGVWNLGDYPQISESDDPNAPQLIIQQILDDVMVVEITETDDEPQIMLAVDSQDAVVLQYLIEAQVPLALVR